MPRVILTGPAKRDIKAAYDWWKHNRSAEQADRWYQGIHAEIRSLSDSPERCSLAAENDLLAQGIRELLFGLGRHPTHRIVFAIDGATVVVFRVRHTSQDALASDDLQE
jgi:plasmid stabilization system protein ParE